MQSMSTSPHLKSDEVHNDILHYRMNVYFLCTNCKAIIPYYVLMYSLLYQCTRSHG